jgi:hypothetical protein
MSAAVGDSSLFIGALADLVRTALQQGSRSDALPAPRAVKSA